MQTFRISLFLTLAFAVAACSSGNSSSSAPDVQGDTAAITDTAVDDDSSGVDGQIMEDGRYPEETTVDQKSPEDLTPDVCAPSCTEMECGDDGCEGSCGDCDDGLVQEFALRG